MKKIIIVLVIVAALAASPLLFSKIAQSQIDSNIEQLNQINGYQVSIAEHQGGYLSSRLRVRVGMDLAAITQDPQLQNVDADTQAMFDTLKEGVLFDVDVHYGPIVRQPNFGLALYSTQVKLADGQDGVAKLKQELGIDEIFSADLTMGLLGSGVSKLVVSPMQMIDPAGRLDFGGALITADLSNYGKAYVIDGTVEQLSFASPDMRFTMDPVTIQGRGEMADIGRLGVGEIEVVFPRLTFEGPANIDVRNFVVATDVSQPSPDLFNVDYRIDLESVSGDVLPQTYSKIVMHMTLENFSGEIMQRYVDTLYGGNVSDGNVYGGNMNAEDPQFIFDMINDLLASSPKLTIRNIGFAADNVVQLAFAGDVSIDQSQLLEPLSLENIEMLIPAVIANLDLKAHRDLVNLGLQSFSAQQSQSTALQMDLTEEEMMDLQQQQLQQFADMLDAAVQDGMVLQQGNTLSIKANFKEGNLTVNDKPVAM